MLEFGSLWLKLSAQIAAQVESIFAQVERRNLFPNMRQAAGKEFFQFVLKQVRRLNLSAESWPNSSPQLERLSLSTLQLGAVQNVGGKV